MRITLFDRSTFKPTKREYTDEGYLRVPGRVARVGVQQYLASDLGLDARSPNEIISVFRPPSEVFSKSSLSSYADSDAVNDHPLGRLVGADNFKTVTVGHVSGEATRDGDFVVANLIIKDEAAIKDIESGKVELSAGYTCEYVAEPGKTEDGIDYEFVQRDIKINHVALVTRARAGAQARLFDSKPTGGNMPTITIDGGKTVDVADQAVATLLQDVFDRKDAEVKKLTSDMEEEKSKSEKTQAEKDALEEELKKKKDESTDSAIAARLSKVVSVTADAKKISGDEFTADGVDVLFIKRAALASVRKTIDWADKSDDYVNAAFDIALESSNSASNDEQLASDSRAKLAADMSKGKKPTIDAATKFQEALTSSWKKTAGVES